MVKNLRPRCLAIARSAQDNYEQLQHQNAKTNPFIQAHGWELVGVCEDRAVSGTSRPFDRPGLGPWLTRPDKYDIILAANSIVFWRGEKHIDEFTEWAEQHGIALWTVAEGNLAEVEVALTRLTSISRRPRVRR